MSFTSYIILLHALLKQTIRHLTIGPSHCIIYYFTHLSNSVHGITKYCDLVLIIFYTPLKLKRNRVWFFAIQYSSYSTHLSNSYMALFLHISVQCLSYSTHISNPTKPQRVNLVVLYSSYSTHLSNCLYDSSLPFPVLYPSYSTRISNHIQQAWSMKTILYPSHFTHISNHIQQAWSMKTILYPSYSTHLSNVQCIGSLSYLFCTIIFYTPLKL